MKSATKIVLLDHQGEKFFGEGPACLLRGIEAHGSLRAAALSMNMAYTKALKLMKNAEAALRFPLTTRKTGGKDGGGSTLTPAGKAFLTRYEAYHEACQKTNQELLHTFFPVTGCVIMASGMSKRFGGNKLMADLGGTPLILRALRATEGLFTRRIVVTRHENVADLCRSQQVDVIVHTLPHRNDTIRLGLEALGDVDCCLFMPGDQPLLRGETVADLLRGWENDRERIYRPICGETPGSPVLFPRWAFPELLTLPEGQGGSWVIKQHPDRVSTRIVHDPYELMDADTPQALDDLRAQLALRVSHPV